VTIHVTILFSEGIKGMLGNFSFSVADDTTVEYVNLYDIDDLIYHTVRFISNYETMIGVQYIFLSDIYFGKI
jgi:hypothetical protein